MTDYYPLIARGVAGLGETTTEFRRALYQRVQGSLLEHLREINPPLEESEILRECLSFDDAVRRVEAETAGREAESLGEVLSRIEATNLVPGREGLNPTDVRLRRPPRVRLWQLRPNDYADSAKSWRRSRPGARCWPSLPWLSRCTGNPIAGESLVRGKPRCAMAA